MQPRERARYGTACAALWAFTAIAAASPGCTQIAGLGVDCVPSCASDTVRLVCDGVRSAHEESCLPSTAPCQVTSCQAGQCVTRDADDSASAQGCPPSTAPCTASACKKGQCVTDHVLGMACGDDRRGVCHANDACLGPDMKLTATLQHACAILHDKSVWCWGMNDYAAIGDGTTTYRDRPVRLTQIKPAIAIGSGYEHTCAIVEDDGSVWCWGNNQGGQTSGSPGSPVPFPTKVTNLPGRFVSVSAGFGHTCALSEAREVYCWGYNDQGQCGVDPKGNADAGAQTTFISPGKPIPNLTEVDQLDTEKSHVCALSRGVLKCWGRNGSGNLARDPIALPYSFEPLKITIPVETPGQKEPNVQSFGIGYDSTYAQTLDSNDNNFLYAWGSNGSGQLGTGSDEHVVTTPARVLFKGIIDTVPLRALAVYRSDGSDQCARVEDANAIGAPFACWGGDGHGELGYGELPSGNQKYALPAKAVPPKSTFMAHGEDFGCSIVSDAEGSIWCWGSPQFTGQSIGGADPTMTLPPQLKALPVFP